MGLKFGGRSGRDGGTSRGKRGTHPHPADVRLYTRSSSRAAGQIIANYSSSFSLATCLLDRRMRQDIRNLYAVVRIADEIVDGTAEHAGLSREAILQMLDDYEAAVLDAPNHAFHTDPVLQAYGHTARRCALDPEHVRAFFASMRMDLHQATHDPDSLDSYIYGSAEVIGLMCLDVFLADRSVHSEDKATMAAGARALGAAFQKINFLRDYAEDVDGLGRTYFPDALKDGLTDRAKGIIVADIRADLATAECSIPLLPFGARAGVIAAKDLFSELTDAIASLPAATVRRRRVSVGGARKAAIAARAVRRAATTRRAAGSADVGATAAGTDASAAHAAGGAHSGGASQLRAVVIGAGIAGLATATLLADEGYDVTVVEKNSEPGGRAGLLEDPAHPGFRWDTGPSWYLMPEAYDNFYALAGTSTEEQLDLMKLEPGYRVFPEGQEPLDVHAEPDRLRELFETIEPGAGEKVSRYLDDARDIYAMSVESFLYTTFASLKSLVGATTPSVLVNLLRNLSISLSTHVGRRFDDVRLRQILSYPAVFLSGRPERTPAMYQLMSYTDLVQGVRYPAGGFTAVVGSLYDLARARGVEFEFGAEATQITTAANNAATGVRVQEPAGERHLAGEIVVSCADVHHTENALLPERLRSHRPSSWRRRNPGIGTVLVLLGVRGELPQLAHHNLMFSTDWVPDFDAVFEPAGTRQHPHPQPHAHPHSRSIYVSKPSESDPSVAPAGHENLFMLVPVAADPAIGHGSAYADQPSETVEAIATAAIEQLADWANIPDLAERIVARHTLGPTDFVDRYHSFAGGALGPAHTLGQSAFLRGKNVSDKVPNLYYAGQSTVPGVGVPMCLISAENVIKRLRGDASTTPLAQR